MNRLRHRRTAAFSIACVNIFLEQNAFDGYFCVHFIYHIEYIECQ